MKSRTPSTKCQFISCGVLGGFAILVGAIFLGVWHELFDFVLRKQLALTPNSYSYDLWKDIPIPLYFDFYMFNWENPQDINSPDPEKQKPKLREMGPYVFVEKREKIILGWDDTKHTVRYHIKKTWNFVPEESAGKLDDLVTTLNVPAVAAVFAVRGTPQWHVPLNLAINVLNIPLAVTKTVGELLFFGYKDVLMDIANFLPPGTLPVILPFDKFGWFYTRNRSETYEGIFTMFTGVDDIYKFGEISAWNDENPTSKFKAPCGILKGSAGEFFPPKPEKGERGNVSLFSPDVCRSITLRYKEEVKVDGLNGYRYWGDEHTFENLTANPDNWCNCPGGPCPPHGAIDVSTCKWGTPAYVSFPHFLHGDPSYLEAVRGLEPREESHLLYVDIEKRTGIPLQVAASLQVNMLLQPYPQYKLFQKVPKVYFPTFWFRQRARIDDELGDQMRLVTRMPVAGYILFGSLALAGVVILMILGIYYLNSRRKGKNNV